MKTWMELRINTDTAIVYLFVTCADETLVAQEMYSGTVSACADYADYYSSQGMQVVVIYQESQTK